MAEGGYEIQKLKYSHEMMVDYILAHPRATLVEIGKAFDYGPQWVGQIISSDAFRSLYAERKKEFVDPLVAASVEDMMGGVLRQSLGIVQEKLVEDAKLKKTDLAVKMIELGSRAAGYGARQATVQVNNYVAMIPQKATDAQDWLQQMGRPVETVTVDQLFIPDLPQGAEVDSGEA